MRSIVRTVRLTFSERPLATRGSAAGGAACDTRPTVLTTPDGRPCSDDRRGVETGVRAEGVVDRCDVPVQAGHGDEPVPPELAPSRSVERGRAVPRPRPRVT